MDGEARTRSCGKKTYNYTVCGANFIDQRLSAGWINAAYLLVMAISTEERNAGLKVHTFLPWPTLLCARNGGELGQVRHLVEDEWSDHHDDYNLSTSSEEGYGHDETDSEAMIKQNWRAMKLTESTDTLLQHDPNNVDHTVIINDIVSVDSCKTCFTNHTHSSAKLLLDQLLYDIVTGTWSLIASVASMRMRVVVFQIKRTIHDLSVGRERVSRKNIRGEEIEEVEDEVVGYSTQIDESPYEMVKNPDEHPLLVKVRKEQNDIQRQYDEEMDVAVRGIVVVDSPSGQGNCTSQGTKTW
ncbi:hypothetical protein SBOR_4232 [Sclerotinia borealis F-4128]|uniref:Uncharacterized protein n=1 Tax=Sclerotinia borealis (strain F-4128) TaxID=1432307 RepID=W9CHQ6_SCLBF|nr:hypothetical protein SBOR_4232 [Sclerotinia borealis F-4128]